jgi:hypothetical protein
MFFFIGGAAAAIADQSANLAWFPSPTPDIAGYAVYYGTTSGVYDFRLDVGSQTNATIAGLAGGMTFFFAVSAYNQLGVESELSNEISFLTLEDWFRRGPWLAPIADRTIHAGSILVISNFVIDADTPLPVLRFSLVQASTSAASIDATNGLFVWRTSSSNTATTNFFAVRVSDETVFNLSDTRSFSVSVAELPSIVSLSFSNNLPVIAWTGIPGQSYRLQFQDVLGNNWLDLGQIAQASMPIVSISDPAPAAGARFYRVVVCPPP